MAEAEILDMHKRDNSITRVFHLEGIYEKPSMGDFNDYMYSSSYLIRKVEVV